MGFSPMLGDPVAPGTFVFEDRTGVREALMWSSVCSARSMPAQSSARGSAGGSE
jgi:hypothetical protein